MKTTQGGKMDSYEILILGKFLLTFSVLLGIPAWQLYSLRRDRRMDERSRASEGGLHSE